MERTLRLVALPVLACALLAPAGPAAQPKKSDAHVKVTARADRPDAQGKQKVTVTLEIDQGWHAYANPVGLPDLAEAQTTVSVTGQQKPASVQVSYPAGKVKEDKVVGNYKVYEGKVDIEATVVRARGDTGPLEVTVNFQVCDARVCLLPASVKVPVQ